MLNTVGTLVMVAIFLVLSIPKMHRLERLKKTDPLIASEEAQEAVVGIFQRVLKWIGVTVEVYGVENIPEDEAVLFVSNHRSYFDILVASTIIENGIDIPNANTILIENFTHEIHLDIFKRIKNNMEEYVSL